MSVGQGLITFLRHVVQLPRLAAPDHSAQLRTGVLQRKVDMCPEEAR